MLNSGFLIGLHLLLASATVEPCEPGLDAASPGLDGPAGQDLPGQDDRLIRLVSPAADEQDVPLNVELRLQGLTSTLDLAAPTWRIRLRDDSGAEVVLERVGRLARATVLLEPNRDYTLVAEPTEAHGCPACVVPTSSRFRTGSEVDLVAPSPPQLSATSLGARLNDDSCGAMGAVLSLRISLTPDMRFLSAQTRTSTGQPSPFFTMQREGDGEDLVFGRALDGEISAGDEVFVAITATDIAGNISLPSITRVRARQGFNNLASNLSASCEVANSGLAQPPSAALGAPSLPENGQLLVRFAFEATALGLQREDGSIVPLDVVDDDGPLLVRVAPREALVAGESLTLISEPCPGCLCITCDVFEPVSLVVTAPDVTAPAAPVIEALLRDPRPAPQNGGQCRHDQSALIVQLQAPPTADDAIAYRAEIRVQGQPGLVVARYAAFVDREGTSADGEGTREIRIDTHGFDSLTADLFELRLTAIDAAGNETTSALAGPGYAPGCSAIHLRTTSSRAGLGLMSMLVLLAIRRRRAADEGRIHACG